MANTNLSDMDGPDPDPSVSSSDTSSGKEIQPCSLCHAISHKTQNITNDRQIKHLLDYIESSSTVTKVEYACPTCVFKLYSIIEKNHLEAIKEEREKRHAVVGADRMCSTLIVEPASPATEENYDPETEDENFDTTIEISENGVDLTPEGLPLPNTNSGAEDEHVSEILVVEESENLNVNNFEVESSASSASLDVMYEKSEFALNTESGGPVDQCKKSVLHCRFCPKTFILQKRFKKHMRIHNGRLSTSRSGRSSPSSKIYNCEHCKATFDNASRYKSHIRIHKQYYYCYICQQGSLSLPEHLFHEAECRGKAAAMEESSRIVTRSISQRSRARTISEKTPKSVSRRTSLSNGDEDDNDCATSITCSESTSFLHRYVDTWVTGTCRAANKRSGHSSLFDNLEPAIVSQKEHDIIQLERIIWQAEQNVYSCFFPDCDYVTNTLREMCRHEVITHKYKTFYFCRKCKGVFTSKVHLDYHIYSQNFGNYCCNKCTARFPFEFQLQHHLIKHQEGEGHPCLYCGSSFLTSQDLKIHRLETEHDPSRKKEMISIDHSMTIENETEPSPPPAKRTYKCTINIMKLPKLAMDRSVPITYPKGPKLFLGELDFEFEPGRNFNCVRTE